jgi:hypothetical protein
MSELKPCPFCGIASNDINDHLIDCWIRWVVPGDNSDLDIEDAYDPRPLEDALRAELARRDEIISRLKEDGERLADNYIAAKRMICACFVADYQDDEIITLHRALMNELEED